MPVICQGKLMHKSKFIDQDNGHRKQEQVCRQKVSRIEQLLEDLLESSPVVVQVNGQVDQHKHWQVQHLDWVEVHLVVVTVTENEMARVEKFQVTQEGYNH